MNDDVGWEKELCKNVQMTADCLPSHPFPMLFLLLLRTQQLGTSLQEDVDIVQEPSIDNGSASSISLVLHKFSM